MRVGLPDAPRADGPAPGSRTPADSASEPHPLRVILDFDGTLVEPNVAIVLVEEFAPDGKRVAHEIDLQLHEGKIGLREAWQRQVAILPVDRIPEMARYVRDHVPLRQGAHEFLELTRRHRIPVTVVSGGLDFYITEVLHREGLELPIRSDRISVDRSGRAAVEHPFGHATCRICGICKAAVVADPDAGARSVFIADGSTDKYGAEVADIIFARRRLLDHLRATGVPCYPFEDFRPVTAQFRRWFEEGEPLPPPRRSGLGTSRCPISRENATGDLERLLLALRAARA